MSARITVTDEMIERARRVLVDEGADSEGGWHSWRCFDRERYPEPCDCTAEIARAALEAAAPLIAAKALREAADGYQTGGWADDLPTGGSRPALILGMSQRAVAWLRARADRIEQGGQP